jgi:hypothetical protein
VSPANGSFGSAVVVPEMSLRSSGVLTATCSGGHAEWWGRCGRRGGEQDACVAMRPRWWHGWWSW